MCQSAPSSSPPVPPSLTVWGGGGALTTFGPALLPIYTLLGLYLPMAPPHIFTALPLPLPIARLPAEHFSQPLPGPHHIHTPPPIHLAAHLLPCTHHHPST